MSNWALRSDAASESNRPEVTDTPIDFSLPYKSRERGAARHFGFFPFFAKKPWPVVQEYIKHYTMPGDLVCDPFAGSGVTPVEVLVLGRRAVAGDINPVARFITRMTAVAPVNLVQLREAYEHVRSTAQLSIESLDQIADNEVQKLLATLDYPHNPIPLTVRRAGLETLAELHTPRQLAGLTILRDAIRAFQNYRENPTGVTEDIQKILKGPKFAVWQPGKAQWVMAPGTPIDPSLDAIDRVRYYVFDLLREKSVVTEGEVRQYLLTRLSKERELEPIFADIAALLRSIAREVEPHAWQFDAKKVTAYKQLRLLFKSSHADRIRDWIEHRQVKYDRKPLRLNPEGFALLGDRLSEANSGNTHFETQYSHLRDVLQTILRRLESNFEEQIERVMAVGDWARYGIDLRNLPYDDLVVQIVLRSSQRPFRLYQQIAEEIFTDLADEDILVQFRLVTLQEWQRAEALAQAEGREEALGITLLGRL